jgi:hypothetical protein
MLLEISTRWAYGNTKADGTRPVEGRVNELLPGYLEPVEASLGAGFLAGGGVGVDDSLGGDAVGFAGYLAQGGFRPGYVSPGNRIGEGSQSSL